MWLPVAMSIPFLINPYVVDARTGVTTQLLSDQGFIVDTVDENGEETGTVFFNDQSAINAEIADMMKEVRNIEAHMQPVIAELYKAFLSGDSADPELRQYADLADEVRINLVHTNYMSNADIAYCRVFEVAALAAEPFHDEMLALHQALIDAYPSDDLEAAA